MDDFLAVIVLYKMSLDDSIAFQTINKSLRYINRKMTVMVYDNTPTCICNPSFFKKENCSIYYIHDKNNSGLSKAYNDASELAKKINKEFLILLDQDSSFPLEYFEVLLNAVSQYRNENLFVPILKDNNIILSPCRFIFGKGFIWNPEVFGRISMKGKSLFNSGICIKNKVYRDIGGYNENIPLDFSDHYFVSKYKCKYSTFVLLPIIVSHSFSSFISSKEKQLSRFQIYCKGTKEYAELNRQGFFLLIWNFLRAIKLSFLYRELSFLSIWFRIYVLK